jgi:hypothetical protein
MLLSLFLLKLRGTPLLVVQGTPVAAIADSLGISVENIESQIGSGFTSVTSAVEAMLDARVESVIGIGGDGTLAAIANTIIDHGSSARLLGIGAGSSNVGPLVTVRGENLERLDLSCLVERPIHGIEVQVNNELVGIAFNDVTLSNLFFGTKDGTRVDLDARAMLNGVRQETQPCSVCGKETRIYKNGTLMIDMQDTPIGQIIASPINDPLPYSGKAISGLICWGPYLGKEGVLTAASAILIRTHIDIDTLKMVEPLSLYQVSFDDGDTIEIVGLESGAVVILDGNPTRALSPDDRVTLRLRRSLLLAYRRMI